MTRPLKPPPRAVALLLVPAALACGLLSRFGPATPTPTPAPTSTPPPVIKEFDGTDQALDALNDAILHNREGVMRAALESLNAGDVQVRFAAVYALSLTVDETNADVLLPVLKDEDLRLRTIAAGSLVGLGKKESLPVLIAALSSEGFIPYSDPPEPMWRLAYEGLSYYTNQDFGFESAAQAADASARLTAAQAWQTWWDQAGAQLRWDASAGRYVP